MPVLTDEVFDASGTVVTSQTRTVSDVPFTELQYRQARRAVRTLALDTTQPTAIRQLARFLLMVGYRDDDADPITP